MMTVRSTVRVKMMLASRASIAAKNAGATADEQEKVFLDALAVPLNNQAPPALPASVLSLSGGTAAHSRVGTVVTNPAAKAVAQTRPGEFAA